MGRLNFVSLNIKNPETVRLAKELAAQTDDSVTGAITVALRERLDRVSRAQERHRAEVLAQLMEIAHDAGPRWTEPFRSTEHGDLLYDERGLPR
jgi:antitoxin VapB